MQEIKYQLWDLSREPSQVPHRDPIRLHTNIPWAGRGVRLYMVPKFRFGGTWQNPINNISKWKAGRAGILLLVVMSKPFCICPSVAVWEAVFSHLKEDKENKLLKEQIIVRATLLF